MTISPAPSGTMSQESGAIWTAEARLQPIPPQSDRLRGTLHLLSGRNSPRGQLGFGGSFP